MSTDETAPSNDGEMTMFRRMSLTLLAFLIGCFPYVYHDQKRVLIEGIDLDATLQIARSELEEGGFDATLAIWAMRDQIVNQDQARTISELYSTHIDRVAAEKDRGTAEFGVWHFAWAISNLYRNGNDGVRSELEDAYLDARKRPDSLTKFKDVASEHVNGTNIYMGDIHGFARAFARSHIVAPGNKNYLQSLDDYRKSKDKSRALVDGRASGQEMDR